MKKLLVIVVMAALVLAGCTAQQPTRHATPTPSEEGLLEETASPTPETTVTPTPSLFAVNMSHPIADLIITLLAEVRWTMFNYPLYPDKYPELAGEELETRNRLDSCERVNEVLEAVLFADTSGQGYTPRREAWMIPLDEARNSTSTIDCHALAEEKRIVCCKTRGEDGRCNSTFSECNETGFVFRYGNSQYIWVGFPIYAFLRDSATMYESLNPVIQENFGHLEAADAVFRALKTKCNDLASKYSVYISPAVSDENYVPCDDERVGDEIATDLNGTRMPLYIKFIHKSTGYNFYWMADFRGSESP